MSIGHNYKHAAKRRKLNADINTYLKAGGEIVCLPYGVRKEDKPSFNIHGKKQKK